MSTKGKYFYNGEGDTGHSLGRTGTEKNQEAFSQPGGVDGMGNYTGSARNAQAAHEKYAAQGLPPFDPEENMAGGMFTEDDLVADQEAQQDSWTLPDDGQNILDVVSDAALLEACKQRICPVCGVAKEAEEQKLRALAEVDNARKRMAREKEEQVRYAAEAVLGDLLPALDNFDLALRHASKEEACKNFVIGVEMTGKLLLDSLKKHGLERVGAVGELFDPSVHEAVGLEDMPDVPDGHVGALLACGYKLRDRLLRPARVLVCKKTTV